MGTYEQRQKIITAMLKEVGVPADLLGHKYLVCALHLMAEEPDALYSMTKIVYPTVAKMCETKATRVERAIRHAIELSFLNMPVDVCDKYFGNSISFAKGKATNSQFLGALLNELKLNFRS